MIFNGKFIYRLIMKRTHGISVAISQVHNHYRQFNPNRNHFEVVVPCWIIVAKT